MRHLGRFKTSILAVIIALALGIGYSYGLTTETATTNTTEQSVEEINESSALVQAEVVRVVDGDTLVVLLGSEEQRVRLIGVDTPESVNPDESKNTEEGQVASDYTKSIVNAGDIVYLQSDTSDTDQYGRLLRYVWLEEPNDTDNLDEIKTKMLNAILIVDGYAEPKAYEPDTAYADVFESLSNT